MHVKSSTETCVLCSRPQGRACFVQGLKGGSSRIAWLINGKKTDVDLWAMQRGWEGLETSARRQLGPYRLLPLSFYCTLRVLLLQEFLSHSCIICVYRVYYYLLSSASSRRQSRDGLWYQATLWLWLGNGMRDMWRAFTSCLRRDPWGPLHREHDWRGMRNSEHACIQSSIHQSRLAIRLYPYLSFSSRSTCCVQPRPPARVGAARSPACSSHSWCTTSAAPSPGLGSILCSCCDESCHACLCCCCDRGRGGPSWLFVKAVQTVRCSTLGYLEPFYPSNFPYIYFLLYFTTSLQKIPPL